MSSTSVPVYVHSYVWNAVEFDNKTSKDIKSGTKRRDTVVQTRLYIMSTTISIRVYIIIFFLYETVQQTKRNKIYARVLFFIYPLVNFLSRVLEFVDSLSDKFIGI